MKRSFVRLCVALSVVPFGCEVLLGYEKEYTEVRADAGAFDSSAEAEIEASDAALCPGAGDDPCCGVAGLVCHPSHRKDCCESNHGKFVESSCVAYEWTSCRARLAAFQDAGGVFDRSAFGKLLDQCASNLKAISQFCEFVGPFGALDRARLLKPCAALFGGTAGEGAPCQSISDCAQSSDPAEVSICEPETLICHEVRFGAAGDACMLGLSPEVCSSGLFCNPKADGGVSGKGICTAEDKKDQPCDPTLAQTFNCEVGFTCTGTCVEAKPPGALCKANEECADRACLEGTCASAQPAFSVEECGAT